MYALFQDAGKHVVHGGTVLDIGAGIRPQEIVQGDRHVCVEPHAPYAARLRAAGKLVIQATAIEALEGLLPVESIVMLDVIEHMEKGDGLKVIELAKERAQRQVIIFTPLGFIAQEHDDWGMGGEYWQTHRSGWTPADFPGWTCLIDEHFHAAKKHGAFFAIWKRPTQ